jgi:hypothetical protein
MRIHKTTTRMLAASALGLCVASAGYYTGIDFLFWLDVCGCPWFLFVPTTIVIAFWSPAYITVCVFWRLTPREQGGPPLDADPRKTPSDGAIFGVGERPCCVPHGGASRALRINRTTTRLIAASLLGLCVSLLCFFLAAFFDNLNLPGCPWLLSITMSMGLYALLFWVPAYTTVWVFWRLTPGDHGGPIWRWRRRTRGARGQCLECSYDLTGNVSGRCPECGTWVKDDYWAGEAERPR